MLSEQEFTVFLLSLYEKINLLEKENQKLQFTIKELDFRLKQSKSQNAELSNSVHCYKEEASKWHYLYYCEKKYEIPSKKCQIEAKSSCDFSNIHYNNIG